MLSFFATLIFTFSSFATTPDISANTTSASCADAVLNTNNGPANIEINWEPNEIGVRWYNGNTLTTSNTCTYDDTLTMPETIPTRTGYTFVGWRVRPQYDFSTLNIAESGIERWEIGWYNNADYCIRDVEATSTHVLCASYPEFKELKTQEWKIHFSWGDIYGSVYCSAQSGNTHGGTWNANYNSDWTATYEELETAIGDKKYCWCQATGYKPSGSDTLYSPKANQNDSTWVFIINDGLACNRRCSHDCAYHVMTFGGSRRAVIKGPFQ